MNKENKPIRVLHVVTRMDSAGIETFIMNIYRSIDRNKVQFDFLTHRSDSGYYDEEIKELGGNIYHVPNINPFHHRKYINSLDEFFNNHNEYKIVHSHINTFSMYILRSAKKSNIPIRVAHSHSTNSKKISYKTVFTEYCRHNIEKYPTHCFACSIDAGEWLFSNSNYQIVNNGIDTNKFLFNENYRKIKRETLNLSNKFVIGNVGRLVNLKNQLFLLDILKEVLKFEANSHLLIVGAGSLKNKILKKAERLKILDKITILENRSDINQLLCAMDVFVFPSKYEGLGIAAIEAQASGLPVVISDTLPKELDITDNIHRLSLELPADIWSKKILQLRNVDRQEIDLKELNSKFNIYDISYKLQNFYLSFY